MECFEFSDDIKKKIAIDLRSKSPQYQVVLFTSKTRPSSNKLWQRMGQVVKKSNDEWVCFKLPVEVNGKPGIKKSRHTVKRKTMDRFDKGIVKLQLISHNHFKDSGRAAFSRDIWTDNVAQMAYSADTMHLIDDYFVLHAQIVSCDAFTENTSRTASKIHRDFFNGVHPFISWKYDNVTVQAANWQVVVKSDATSNNTGEEMSLQFEMDLCFCHRILTCISYVLRKQTQVVNDIKQPPAYDKSEIVFDMIADSKALVTYMKQTYLNRELKHKMKQDVPTRFDGLLIMLQSVTAKLDETINLLKKKKHENRAEKIYAQVLEELIQLLDYFKLASNSLEPFNTLTLHLLGIWLANQKTHLQPRDELVSVDGANGKSENIAPIKKQLLDQLKEKYILKSLHATIAYLDSLQKNRLKDYGFTQQLIDQGHIYLKDIMRKVGASKLRVLSMSSGRRTSLTKTNSVKRPHTVVFNIGPDREYSDDNESVEDHDEPVKDSQLEAPIDVKLAEYRLLKVFKNDKVILLQPDTWKKARSNGDIKHDVGLLPWWQLRSTKYPILARAVQAILCIPASSSMLECTFSSAGNTRSEKHSSLNPNTLNALLYLRSN
ncbi:LOW QUALITY PROTEIN: hypothetical protein MARPO_0001s0300 [Marchantia polymorpha]|uniref:HAT C-terminal dimerisation domain-containing protein n=1 Tax=Marchantia polymorpha TaxID=3197 RepID=A0A2R6XW15_MARPO|nr:LOW QUALITY PROTEIN: hypothetical protein MARPO_0001s0300 [Marchantia polymorpha]|eukprot:PTQ50293.1 LOW QUALITY PROTEIN: hypothetical protein MARPO_0001s0300 [Marchantia polymorpha]